MDTNIIITETPILEAPSMPSFATPTLGSSLDWGIILRYTLIVLILAFLGFNIFTYLGKVTEETAGFLKPILSIFGYGAATTVKQTTNVAATGAKGLVDVAAGTVTSGVGLLEKGLDAKKTQGQTRNKIDDTTPSTQSTSNAVDQAVTRNKPQQPRGEPVPDDAGSRTQLSRGSGKAGYCYIGEDRGFRSCIKVGEADMCMSGDIFPTQEICINPSLRA
jgi:hypothetical protein